MDGEMGKGNEHDEGRRRKVMKGVFSLSSFFIFPYSSLIILLEFLSWVPPPEKKINIKKSNIFTSKPNRSK